MIWTLALGTALLFASTGAPTAQAQGQPPGAGPGSGSQGAGGVEIYTGADATKLGLLCNAIAHDAAGLVHRQNLGLDAQPEVLARMKRKAPALYPIRKRMEEDIFSHPYLTREEAWYWSRRTCGWEPLPPQAPATRRH